ncbi:hypothetical protein PHYPO_G00183770 [Pangasianodon hypophthalmus]|uniref:KASH domain-containing protein n=1 Tax=Pangasianodon hypophthalmus TaxID=310915 RepID=A0A5N5PQX8_PANHP|nr:hypothetical protein PHYPO_G00183770 [Pangasianodon hypophthalmus]
MEECVPGLIKDLMELCESLEEGIRTERNCVQLVEQHSAAQDWLREQVKGFGALPTDRHGLQGSINTLKALLQTVEREEREMKELDSAKDALISLCTPGGRDALTLETGHLHDLCASSEREIKERLVVCETRLADIELKIAERAERLRAQAECILNDLRAQECLGFVEGNRNISQLQENWNILKTCEKELNAIEGKVRDLGQAVRMVPPEEDLPSNVISLVDTVTQQYCRLQSKLSERQNDCADSAVHCMRDTLQALRSWTQSTHTQPLSDSAYTIQAMIEEGAVLHKNLQEAVSNKQLLQDSLGQELTDKLERDGSNALKDADTLINQLQERLQDLEEERTKNKALTLSLETQPSHLVSEVSCGWPSTHTLDTTTKIVLDWSKAQDISSAPVASAKSSVVESFEMVHRDVAVSIIEETPAKTEQPMETVVQDVVLADNQSDDTLTSAFEQKSGVSEVSMTVDGGLLPESHTAEPLLVSALDESGAEFKTDDLPTTTSTITSKLEEPTDVAGSESLMTGIPSDLHVLESVTERINPSEELEERALQLNAPVSTIVEREIPTELSEEISGEIDFPTEDWSLTALHFDQSKLKTDGLSTTALAVQSDVVPEVGPAKGEEKIEMKGMEKIQLALCDKLHDTETSLEGKAKESIGSDKSTIYAHSLDQESDAIEEAHRKWSFTSDTCELMSEDGKMPTKKIAALILDKDIVNIHATEVPGSTDHNAGRIDSASDTGFDATLSQQEERLDTSDETRKEFDCHTSLDQQEQESAEENVDRTLQTLLLSGQTTETQILTGSSEPTTTYAEREGTWITNNGPQEVQRVMEPLEHWTVNNGPRETQRRYIILERREGLEICREPAAETNVPVLDAAASKPGRVVTDVSELEATENVEQEVGKESVETEDSERVTLNAKKPSKTLEIIGTFPASQARRKLERLSISTEDKLVEEVDKVIVEVESTKRTTVKGETKPTPPSRRSKESERLSVSSEALSEEVNIPVPTSEQYKQDETQLPPEEVLPTPPNRRHKDKLGDERLSLDLDSTTPPERRQKEKAEHQQLEQERKGSATAVEEPLVKPTPPVVSKTQEMEETLVKPTPPTRRRDSRNVTEPVCDSSDLDKTRTKEIAVEESLEKPTPPVRRKASPEESDFINPLVSKPQGTEDLLVKPTPPTRRRDSGSVRDIVSKEMASQISKSTELDKTRKQGSAVEETLVKPTPPVRRKVSQISQTQEMEEILVKPTPPARRRGSRNFSDRAYEEMACSTYLEKTVTQERALEEPLIKPTPPVRRKVSSQIESDTVSVLSKIHEVGENVVKPTPPTRRRDSRNMSDMIARSTDLEKEKALAEPLLKPTPPVRRKTSQIEMGQEASQVESDISSVVSKPQEPEETLAKPTPPTRRGSKIKSDTVAEVSQSEVQDGLIEPTLREKDNEVEHESIKVSSVSTEPEEALPKPTTPTDQKEDTTTTDLDTIPIKVEEPPIQSISPTGSIEKSVEIQPMIKQEDEQPEKELCSALGTESTEGLTEIKSISLVEAQLQDADKLEIPSQDASVARTIDVSEALEEEQQQEEQEEEPLGATMNNIFTEIEKMPKTRPNSLLIESRPYEDPLDVLNTSDADLEAQLNRLVFSILSCRNCPAVLNPTDMAKQVEEAEFCRQSAQKQVSSISKQDHVNGDISALAVGSAHDPEAMQRLSCQWTEALWDASGTVHTKEAQLQLVIDYDRQMQKAKATLEKLAGELESLKMCPVESSFVEEQRLRSFLRTMEQERTVLGELIQTYSQLSPHLSQPERAAAQSQQSILQCEWKVLEKSAEKTLHNVSAYTKESFDLLEDINTLKDHMENFHKILGSPWISSAAWDSKRAQAIIELSAELTAAKQRYFDLHQSFEAFSQGCNFKIEAYNIQQGLWSVKDHMDLIVEELAFLIPTSSNPTMVKIVKVITEALAWAKKTEYDIENRQRKVSLLPEEVHRQIKDLKKLHSEMTSKQTQLTTLTEEVTQVIPDLDEPDVPVVTSFLELLASLSKSTAEKLATAMEEIQLSLQTREKISEQVADVDSWILCHLHKKSLSREDFQSLSAADLDRRLRQSQDTLREAEKHSGIAEALLMKNKDITSELSISENAWLCEKLTKLQEDIKGIINYEKSSILEITDILQNQESSEQKMASLEQKLRQIMIDMKGHTFPITKDSLSAIEPFKRTLVEHKFQVEQINTSAEGKRRELLCVISELHHKIKAFHFKSQIHERFLSLKQRVEDLRENVELYVPKTKDESIAKEERYKICQSLLTQIPLIKLMYKEASDELTNISPDLYPSQLTTEQERLKQNLDSLNTWEMAIRNNLQIVEWDILKEINYLSEQRVVRDFLKEVNEVLEKTYEVEYNQGAVEDEIRKFLKLKKNIEARMRVLEVLEIKNGHQQGSQNAKDIADLAKGVLDNCDQRLVDLSKAKESLKTYSRGVRSAIQFLQRTESVLLPSLCSPRSCSERLKDVQQALLTLDKEFQSPITEIQTLAPFSPLFSAQKVEQLQVEILGCLLVRMSTLKAQAQLRLEALERCVNSQRSTRVCYEELCRRVRDSETTLAECASKKITSQMDCRDQQETLKTLVKEVDMLPGKLDELREWCPVQGCCGNRDDAVNSLWGQVARLRQCARHLLEHSERRGEEWIHVGKSMEKASSVLEQMEAELPERSREKATAEELQELLQFWSPYQDRLDCEHRALSALELRVARLLRVPSHLEQAPPIPLCQELQVMQERYHSLKSRSAQGRKAVQAEMEERTKVCEELQEIRDWLVAAGAVLSELEQAPSTERLQELHSELCTQKAVLQRIMEGLRMKYSDMYTLVPVEIDGPLQEVSHSLQEVVKQVEVAVQKSGPLHRLDAKLSEINTALDAVQSRLRNKCPNVAEAESALKRVWDELDGLHSRLAEVEVELQDLSEEKPEETQALMEKLSQTQQLHTSLSKQAEDRTAFLNKIHGWLQEHEEMVKGSQSWITESQSWLTAPYTYTTAKCLDSHVNALQMVLDDSAQIRRTLQGFESVLKEMASVCDVSGLQQELCEADRRVADMQSSLLGPLKILEHAAAEVDAMESELRIMEKDVTELRSALTSKQGISQDKFRAAENRIELMKRTVAELKSCKTGLHLPEGAENTLTVFSSADLLLNKLLELEQLALEHTVVVSEPCEMSSTLRVPPTIAEEEPQDGILEQGQVEIVRMTEDVLTRSGAVLMTIKETTLEQRLESSAHTQLGHEEEEEEMYVDVREDTDDDDDDDDCYEDAREENEGMRESPSAAGCERVMSCNTEDTESGGTTAAAAAAAAAASASAAAAADSAEQERKESDAEAGEGECVASEPSDPEAASKPEAAVRTQSPPRELERGAWKGKQIESERLKTHTSSTPPMFREVSHTHVETTDSQETVTPLQVMHNSAEEALRREELTSPVSGSKDTHSVINSDQGPHTPVLSAPSLEPTFTRRHERTADSLAAGEPWHLGKTPPLDGSLHSCHERATQMELWLEKAQLSLHSDVQQSVEEQLRTCQEMFMEIEQKVASVSAPGHDEEEQKALSAKLQLLKNKLVTFQLLLQERHSEEKVCAERERPLQARLKRSTSVQEMLSPKRAKLFRQSSLQQQRELEKGLIEQKDLMKVIAARGSRVRLQSQTAEEHTRLVVPAAEVTVEAQRQEGAESVHRKWTHLHRRLSQKAEEQQEEEISHPPACVWSSADGAACLQELQSHIIHLRELGHTAASAPDVQVVDEGLFEVLSGITLSLSSLFHTLVSQSGATHTDTHTQLLQLQSLSAELSSLSAELTSQGSEVIRSLVSVAPAAGVCVDLLQDRVCELQNVLSEKQKQLQKQLDHTLQKQSRIKHMHVALLANTSTLKTLTNDDSRCDPQVQLQAVAGLQQELQQRERELAELRDETERQGRVTGLTLDITPLESVLDSVYGGVYQHAADLQCSVEQQQQCERVLKDLQDQLELGKQRLTYTTQLEPHTTEQLHTLLNTHTKFFLSLDSHVQALQRLTARMPGGALCRWDTAVAEVEGQVDELQCQARKTGTALQMTLQVWTQWEESQSWLEKLLQGLEHQLPSMHSEEQTEEALRRSLSTYETLQATLEANAAQIGLVLDQASRLRKVGVSGRSMDGLVCRVGVATLRLKQRLAALQRKMENGRGSAQHLIKLWKSYHCDSTAMTEWMNKARERLNSWKGHVTSSRQAISNFNEFIELCKELEVKSALKASVISAGTEILHINEREHTNTHTPSTGSTHHNSQSEENATCKDISSVKDDPSLEDKEEDSSINKALTPESTHSDICNEGDDNVQDESLVERTLFEASSSSDIPPDGNASTKMSEDATTSSGTDVVQVIALSPVLLSLKDHLTEVEHSWVELDADITAVQQKLHQRVVESVCPQSLLSEVCKWISGAEGCLQDAEKNVPSSNTAVQLSRQLNTYKELKRAQVCVQMSVDFLNQTLLKHTEPNFRYKHTAFAEQLGEVNLRWITLQTHLYTQTQYVEQQLSICTDRDGKLRLLRAWVKGRETWMRLAERPVSHSAAETHLKECEELEEELKAKSAKLNEMRKRRPSDDEEHTEAGFISHINTISQALTELPEQNGALKQTLHHACEAWSAFESGRSQVAHRTLGICQSLEHCHAPHTSFTALQKRIDKLQALQSEAEEVDKKWEELNHTFSSLIGWIHTGTSYLLSEELEKEKLRWSEVKQDLTHTSVRLQALLQAWKQYSDLSSSCSEKLQQEKERLCDVSKTASEHNNDTETLATCIQRLHDLLENTHSLRTDSDRALEASKELIGQMEPTAAAFVQSECRMLTRGLHQHEEAVKRKLGEMQEDIKQLQEFEQLLESLETHLKEWTSRQRHTDTQDTDISKCELLELSRRSADVEMLNEVSYRLTLSDPVTRKLQSLNRKWTQASAHAQERCSELQAVSLQQQAFEERCETWMSFLQRMEDSLAGEIASTYPGLREQLRTHQRFQAELSLGHQILHSVITEALHLLQRGEVEDRSDFLLKLAQLREHWQGAVQRAAQRRTLVDGLIRHWHLYTHTLRKLNTLLTLAHTLLAPAGLTHCSVTQLRCSLSQLKRTELLFQRSLSSYLLLLDVGRQLFSVSDEETQTRLQTDLATLQEDWERSQCMLGKRRTLTANVIKTWESCTSRLADLAQRLEDVKVRVKEQPIQEMEEELIKELQESLEDWAVSLCEASSMKTDVSQYIITEDVLMLQEQEEHLHGQWEELCLKVSLRKQEIADRLNAWIIFNEKNRELCEWLTQMENKMTHSAELSIEEMVEKLKKDCMEEINLFSENKTHLKQLGEQLITASNKTKESEINDKIKGINERWQHLFNHIEARVRKLKETLMMVQQLDKNMSNLRTWLSRIEGELTKPIVFGVCHSEEIQCKLAEQQELQKDIEQHTEGVASVLTLCDMLLHDADACSSDVENDSIQQTTHSLDRRWRNICALSMERRMRIEETWRLWCKFLEDYSRFEDWLSTAERTAANPASTDVLYTCAKEELKKFELELVNKQYRRLARENRTDTACKLKTMVNEGNRRWDELHRRVSAIIRRLKHFTSQREEFEGTRDAVLVWLTEMDLQLTNVEHFSESDVHDKMRQLKAFQQEITLNTNKIDSLIVFGEKLIQKSSPLDAVLIEDELEELHSYCQEVFSRVARFHHRLVNTRPVVDDERDFSDRDPDMEDSSELTGVWERDVDMEDAATPVSIQPSACVLFPPSLEPSGRETPVSVDSIPLEWDHTVDVGGSSSPEDEDEATYYSALSDVEVTESSESFVKATARALSAASVTEPSWQDRKRIIHSLTSTPTHIGASYHPEGYAKLMSECTDSIDNVKRVKHFLDDDEPLEGQGLTILSTADKQRGVIERWEILQARTQANAEDLGAQHHHHKLTSDLGEITTWLDRVLPELERLQRGKEHPSIRDMESSICKLKESQRMFGSYKALMIGVNLSGRRLPRGDGAEVQELKLQLQAANQKWTQACAALDTWENQLHLELLQCQEFHETLHSLLLWLARAESQRYMVNIHDPNGDVDVLQEHRDTLKAVQRELLGREEEVQMLQQISSHILHLEQGEESMEAKEKVHVINNKLRLLLRQISHDLNTLKTRLKSEGSSVDDEHATDPALMDKESRAVERRPSASAKNVSRSRPFLYRVLRAAFPLHLLFLLLLVLACLVPASEDDYSCALSNNFARSFYPMLRYTNGPPPT